MALLLCYEQLLFYSVWANDVNHGEEGVLDRRLDPQVMPKALRNSTFTDFLRQYGLDLHSVEYVSAEYRPGIQTHNALG